MWAYKSPYKFIKPDTKQLSDTYTKPWKTNTVVKHYVKPNRGSVPVARF